MKKILESYSGIIPALLVLFYALGYVYLKIYYAQFGISIEFYITLTDLLFYSIKSLLFFFAIYAVLNFIAVFFLTLLLGAYFRYSLPKFLKLRDHPASTAVKERYIDIKISQMLFSFIPVFYILFACILITITGELLFSLTYMMFSIFYFYYTKLPVIDFSHRKSTFDKLFERNSLSIFLLLMVFILNLYAGFRSAEHLKRDIFYITKPIACEFNYETENISTENGSNQIFVGETTDYIFIYSSCNLKTMAYDKDSIKNLRFISEEQVSDYSVRYYLPWTTIFTRMLNNNHQ